MTQEQHKEYENIFANNFHAYLIYSLEDFKKNNNNLLNVIIMSMHDASNKVKSRNVNNLKIEE